MWCVAIIQSCSVLYFYSDKWGNQQVETNLLYFCCTVVHQEKRIRLSGKPYTVNSTVTATFKLVEKKYKHEISNLIKMIMIWTN